MFFKVEGNFIGWLDYTQVLALGVQELCSWSQEVGETFLVGRVADWFGWSSFLLEGSLQVVGTRSLKGQIANSTSILNYCFK